jgi:fibronectin-binding autotransporter adhesin
VTLYQPGAPVYEAYPQALQALNGVGTMRQRIGARQWSGQDGDDVWGRIEGGHTHLEPAVTTTQAELNIDRWNMQFGVDRPISETFAGGRLVGGLTAHYGEASTDVASPFGGGGIDTKGYGFGATATWTTTAGAYVDAQAQASWFDSDLSSQVLGERAKGADGHGYAVSLEAGQPVAVGSAFSLTPQAQLTYSKVDFDSFTDSFGANVSSDRGDSLVGRLGLALDHGCAATEAGGVGHVYGLVNLTHEFLDGARVDVSGAPLVSRAERTWGGLAAGGTYSWAAGRYTLYGEASADTSLSGFGDSYSLAGAAGFRMRF